MAKSIQKVDPRTKRTERLLLDAFSSVINTGASIRQITVLQIAVQAGVNRVTFYAHFTDKYELLDSWKRDFFRQRLEAYLAVSSRYDVDPIENIIDAFIDCMTLYISKRRRANRYVEPLMDEALRNELANLLESELYEKTLEQPEVMNGRNMTLLSWGIFGYVKRWCEQQDISREACRVELISFIQNSVH
jgi:AcrR family transcriptional regulator